ncbi:hypothetical protein V4F39_09960 [Aquincola sp. MAHUQ-54]|uniref:Uncharacterized protein n=1 Tax=Aquincola agrisoli TaxID=3119538 RepID=A0AAW9QFS6_9BURK
MFEHLTFPGLLFGDKSRASQRFQAGGCAVRRADATSTCPKYLIGIGFLKLPQFSVDNFVQKLEAAALTA